MKRRSTAEEKELADRARLLRWWKAWHREQRDLVLAGEHGAALGELLRMFENVQHIQPSQANSAITKFREARGEEPIDDALPDEPLRVFQVIRGIVMNQFPTSAGESPPELIRQNSGEVP